MNKPDDYDRDAIRSFIVAFVLAAGIMAPLIYALAKHFGG